MGCTHHTLYFIYLPIKLENLINFALKYSNLILHGIYVLCKIEYPIASGGLCPQTLRFRDKIPGLAPPLSKSQIHPCFKGVLTLSQLNFSTHVTLCAANAFYKSTTVLAPIKLYTKSLLISQGIT